MAQDIRDLLKGENPGKAKLSKGHKNRFEAMLDKEMPQEKNSFSWLKIAAIALVLISVSFFGYQYLSDFTGNINNTNKPDSGGR